MRRVWSARPPAPSEGAEGAGRRWVRAEGQAPRAPRRRHVKTQLISLDPHDDHASARDKLAWARADRIVLIWPPHGRILTRPLDLTLLLRAARAHGGQVGGGAPAPPGR